MIEIYPGDDIQAKINSLPTPRTVVEWAKFIGNFTLYKQSGLGYCIGQPNLTGFDITEALLTLANDQITADGQSVIRNIGTSQLHILGGEINANRQNQAAKPYGVDYVGVSNFSVKNALVHDAKYHGFHFDACTDGEINNCEGYKCVIGDDPLVNHAQDAFFVRGPSTRLKFINCRGHDQLVSPSGPWGIGYGGGIEFRPSTAGAPHDIDVIASVFNNNGEGGVLPNNNLAPSQGPYDIRTRNCTMDNNYFGIDFSRVQNCLAEGNTITNSKEADIDLWTDGAYPCSGIQIVHNNLGTILNRGGTATEVHYNNILKPSGFTYAIENVSTTKPVNASNNWWGTIDSATIASIVTAGVTWQPFLTEPYVPPPVVTTLPFLDYFSDLSKWTQVKGTWTPK